MNEDLIKSEILDGLLQVDDSFVVSEFAIAHDKTQRKLNISFTASTENDETISEVIDYA